jgi:CheY-like chemotaxis protein
VVLSTNQHLTQKTMSAKLEIVGNSPLNEYGSEDARRGRDRRSSSRAMVSVPARICGGVGTLQSFEEIVTCLDIARGGLRIPTFRAGYFPEQLLQVTCPYWDTPTAINVPRNAKVIRCKVTPNLGYEVALQFLPGAIADNPTSPLAASPFASQVRVLVVESDRSAGRALRELLEKDGYHVVAVQTPREALEIIQTEVPHVIVAEAEAEGTDLSGHDLCAIVKASPHLQHIPAILVTTAAMPSDYASSHLIGAVVCLTKPYKVERLRQAVRLVASPPSQISKYSAGSNIASFVRTA